MTRPPIGSTFTMPPGRHHVQDTTPRGLNALHLAELTKPFHERLLQDAKGCLATNQHELAVVLAQASAELCTEWAITNLFATAKTQSLAQPVLGLFRVIDICNDGVRSVYSALSGDKPDKQPFWRAFKEHHTRRHAAVHKGKRCSLSEAEASLNACEAFVTHVEAVVARKEATRT